MRKKGLYEAQSDNKITEKQFLRMLMGSVFSILLCMSCLVGTTWAWYSYDISNTDNVIQVGKFDAYPVVKGASGVVYPVDHNNGSTYHLTPGTYEVKIPWDGNNTSAGYCIVILDDKKYSTVPIDANNEEISFKVKISAPSVAALSEADEITNPDDSKVLASVMKIVPAWGAATSAENPLLGSSNSMGIESVANVFVDKVEVMAEPEKETTATTETTGTTESSTTTEASGESTATTAATENPTDEETPTTTAATGTTESSTTTEGSGESTATTAATEKPTDKETPTTTVTTGTTESSTTTEASGESTATTAATEKPTDKETPTTTAATGTTESSTTTETTVETAGTTAATEKPTDKETPTTTETTGTTENSTTTEDSGESTATTAATENPTENETPATTENNNTSE